MAHNQARFYEYPLIASVAILFISVPVSGTARAAAIAKGYQASGNPESDTVSFLMKT